MVPFASRRTVPAGGGIKDPAAGGKITRGAVVPASESLRKSWLPARLSPSHPRDPGDPRYRYGTGPYRNTFPARILFFGSLAAHRKLPAEAWSLHPEHDVGLLEQSRTTVDRHGEQQPGELSVQLDRDRRLTVPGAVGAGVAPPGPRGGHPQAADQQRPVKGRGRREGGGPRRGAVVHQGDDPVEGQAQRGPGEG